MATGDTYVVLGTEPDEATWTSAYTILYWIMIDRPATIDGKPVVLTPASELPRVAKGLECVQERSEELDAGQAAFVTDTVIVPRYAPAPQVREYICRRLAKRRTELLREYYRHYPEPRQTREPQDSQEPPTAVTQRPKPQPNGTARRQCAACGSEEAMVGRRADATTCSNRCRKRAQRRRRAELAEGREASREASHAA